MQIRSHAQKYFLKVQKNGTGERVPPPRPKRKSAQPYPQKAPKNGICAFLVECTSFCCVGLHVLYGQNNSSCSKSLVKNVVFRQIIQQPIQVNLYGEHNMLCLEAQCLICDLVWSNQKLGCFWRIAGITPEVGEIGGFSLAGGLHPSSSLSGSSPGGWSQHMLARNHVAQDSCIRGTAFLRPFPHLFWYLTICSFHFHLSVLLPIIRCSLCFWYQLSCVAATPDFSEVYKFIGSVFDPGVSGHLRTLKEMSPIDRETVRANVIWGFSYSNYEAVVATFGLGALHCSTKCWGLSDEVTPNGDLKKWVRATKGLMFTLAYLAKLHWNVQVLLLMRNLSINLSSPDFKEDVSNILFYLLDWLLSRFWKYACTLHRHKLGCMFLSVLEP